MSPIDHGLPFDRRLTVVLLCGAVYHGTSREEGLDFELEPTNPRKADVVLTSYGVLASEHQKWSDKKKKKRDFADEPISLYNCTSQPCLCQQRSLRRLTFLDASGTLDEWLRIVLDEAHNVRLLGRSTTGCPG